MLIVPLLIFGSMILTIGEALSKPYPPYIRDIDEDIQYGVIHPYIEEWDALFQTTLQRVPSPMHFWFRCIDREVRAYFLVEDMMTLNHGKELDMPAVGVVQNKFKFRANGEAFKVTRFWHGGGDLFFDIPPNLTSEDYVDITIDGFQHFTRFHVGKCVNLPFDEQNQPLGSLDVNRPPNSGKPVVGPHNRAYTKYLMHIHLREFRNASTLNTKAINGVAKHMMYHRCALKLDKYEITIQSSQVELFMKNEEIAYAVKQGWMNFIIRNPIIPAPIDMRNSPHSNCYYQAYVENLNLLRYWKRNVKIYYFDSDEYLWINPEVTSEEFLNLIHGHEAVGFDRYMMFCKNCPHNHPELKHLSFGDTQYKQISPKLNHPKLIVDPSSVGCYIVHWAGCGAGTHVVPEEKAFIAHFENLYSARWRHNDPALKTFKDFIPSKVNLMCDPSKYDWRSPMPSFHPR